MLASGVNGMGTDESDGNELDVFRESGDVER